MEINELRTIKEAARILKKEDSNTCITYSTLLRLCKEHKIKYVKCGNRYYVNVNSIRLLVNI